MISAINSSNAYNCNGCKRPSFGAFVPARVYVRKTSGNVVNYYPILAKDAVGALRSFIYNVQQAAADSPLVKKLSIIRDFNPKWPNINTTQVGTGSDARIWALTGDTIKQVRTIGAEIYRAGDDPMLYGSRVRGLISAAPRVRNSGGTPIGLDIIVDEKNVIKKGVPVGKSYKFADLDVVTVDQMVKPKPSKSLYTQGELF